VAYQMALILVTLSDHHHHHFHVLIKLVCATWFT